MKKISGIIFGGKYAYIYRSITKIRSTMLCLRGFKLYSQWVTLIKLKIGFKWFVQRSLES